jgi:hypothetical protein
VTLENVFYETKKLLASVAREALVEALKYAFAERYDFEPSTDLCVEIWKAVHPLKQGLPVPEPLDINFIDYLCELENAAGGWMVYAEYSEEFEFYDHDEFKRFVKEHDMKEKQP